MLICLFLSSFIVHHHYFQAIQSSKIWTFECRNFCQSQVSTSNLRICMLCKFKYGFGNQDQKHAQVQAGICSLTGLLVEWDLRSDRGHTRIHEERVFLEAHLPSLAESLTKGCSGRCYCLSVCVWVSHLYSVFQYPQHKCSEHSLTSAWKPHLFLPASHFGDIFAYSIQLSVSVPQGGIFVIVLLCLCCCFYLNLSILILGAAILCQGVLRYDTLQCILNILNRSQALAHMFSLSHYNPNRRTLISVLLLYCFQRTHWKLTDRIFHASAAGEDLNGTFFSLVLFFFFFFKANSQRVEKHKAKLFKWL